jgi:HNH endonuclease/AP2 domain
MSTETQDEHLAGLTDAQREAVEHRDGACQSKSKIGYRAAMRARGPRFEWEDDGLPPVTILNQIFRLGITNGEFDGTIFHLARPVVWFATQAGGNSWNTKYAGTRALDNLATGGYLEGTIFYRELKAHRVIFKMTHGWCPEYVDHENGNRVDNRPSNLKPATKVENGRNMKRKKNNTSGVNGVSWKKENQKWVAKIVLDKKQVHLGYFNTLEEATAARKQAEEGHGFTDRHGN